MDHILMDRDQSRRRRPPGHCRARRHHAHRWQASIFPASTSSRYAVARSVS